MTMVVAMTLVTAALAAAEEAAQGAKALFGAGNEEIFYPRDRGGSQAMDPSSRVTDEHLTSFYQPPEAPGVAYSLEILRRGESNIIAIEDPRRAELRTGDRIRLRLVPNFTGFAYVLEAKDGDPSLIYPVNYGSQENMIKVGRESYVPASGWLKLVDPAGPFHMRVLFKPGVSDYPLNQPAPHPAIARVSLTEAIHREWQSRAGQKGMIFEADRSYLGTEPRPIDSGAIIDRDNYTTNYVVVDRQQKQEATTPGMSTQAPVDDTIAIEILIRHVAR